MSLKKVICPKCGEQIDADTDKEASICPKCSEAFVTSKAELVEKENDVKSSKDRIALLVAKGKKCLSSVNYRIENKETQADKDLTRIYLELFELDPNNVYGHIFKIFAHAEADEDYQTIIERGNAEEHAAFATKLVEFIKLDTHYLDDDYPADILGSALSKCASSITTAAGIDYLVRLAKKDDSISPYIAELRKRFEDGAVTIYRKAYERFRVFFFTADSVNGSDFKNQLLGFMSGLKQFAKMVAPLTNVFENSEVQGYADKIYSIIRTNFGVVLAHNQIYAELFLKNSMAALNRSESDEEINDMLKVVVTDIGVSKRPATLTLYPDKVIVSISGFEPYTILVKDIILLNQSMYLSTSEYLRQTTIWWDLVYFKSETSYSLLHFGHDMGVSETFNECIPYNQINSWAINNNIKQEMTDYDDRNPFAGGLNGLTYIDTMPDIPSTATKSGCYVATCVYGSYDCPQVWTLRRYRDFKLNRTWHGRLFIKTYYAISPILVKLFGKTEWFKKMWRGKLDRMVKKCQEQGYADTPYNDLY